MALCKGILWGGTQSAVNKNSHLCNLSSITFGVRHLSKVWMTKIETCYVFWQINSAICILSHNLLILTLLTQQNEKSIQKLLESSNNEKLTVWSKGCEIPVDFSAD